jgi:hypothetical protein
MDSIILIAYDWNGRHEEGQVVDPGTEGLVVTADGHVIAHPPYRSDRLRVGVVTYEDEPEDGYYGPEVRC